MKERTGREVKEEEKQRKRGERGEIEKKKQGRGNIS